MLCWTQLGSPRITNFLLGWYPTADPSQPWRPRPQLLGPTAGAGSTRHDHQDRTKPAASVCHPPSQCLLHGFLLNYRQLGSFLLLPVGIFHFTLIGNPSLNTFFLSFQNLPNAASFFYNSQDFCQICASPQFNANQILAVCMFRNFLLWTCLQYQQSKIILYYAHYLFY